MTLRVSGAVSSPHPCLAAPDYPQPPYKHGSSCTSGVAPDAGSSRKEESLPNSKPTRGAGTGSQGVDAPVPPIAFGPSPATARGSQFAVGTPATPAGLRRTAMGIVRPPA